MTAKANVELFSTSAF